MGLYPARSVERAMRFQEVILRAMSKQITWWQAAEILGMTPRNIRRYRQRLEKWGYDGLIDGRTRRPSARKVPFALLEQVLLLYRERYFDFNVRHFHEKLRDEHGLTLSYTWVKNALQQAGLVAKRKKRGRHHKRRPRRPLAGMLIHIDGSEHAWLGPEHGRFDLITVMDDATSEIYYARFVEEESTADLGGAAKGGRKPEHLLLTLLRPGQPLRPHLEGRQQAGSRCSHTGRPSSRSTRHRVDPGRLSAGPRSMRAFVRNPAGTFTAGAACWRH